MLVGYFGLTLLHTPKKKKGATSELNLEMAKFYIFCSKIKLDTKSNVISKTKFKYIKIYFHIFFETMKMSLAV